MIKQTGLRLARGNAGKHVIQQKQASRQAGKLAHPSRGGLGSMLFAGLAQCLLARPLEACHKALCLLLFVLKCY